MRGKVRLTMLFYLRGEESVKYGIKRIVEEEIAQAIKEIDNSRLKRSDPPSSKTLQENPRCTQASKTEIRRDLSV
jgi:hypothetical protein